MAYTATSDVSIDVKQVVGGKLHRPSPAKASQVSQWPTKDEIKEATVGLLRRLIVLTQTLDPLPLKRELVMRLTYYPDITPSDYTPDFFTSTFDVLDDHKTAPNVDSIQIGSVATPHHSLTFSYVFFVFLL